MIDCREHPNEVVLVKRDTNGDFAYTQEGLLLAEIASKKDNEIGVGYGHINAFSRQYTRQRKILGGV